MEFQIIGRAEQFMRTLAGMFDRGAGAFRQPRPQNRMGQIGRRLGPVANGIENRGLAVSQPLDLRENIPHPVAFLAPVAQLRQGLAVNRFLRRKKPPEIENYIHVLCYIVKISTGICDQLQRITRFCP